MTHADKINRLIKMFANPIETLMNYYFNQDWNKIRSDSFLENFVWSNLNFLEREEILKARIDSILLK